jgi:hypothetical protein
MGSCSLYGWKQTRTCAERGGEVVFDVWKPTGCTDKASGVETRGAEAMKWCKNGGSENSCWLPYSMDETGDCFAYDLNGAGQWVVNQAQTWRANAQKGGSNQPLAGTGPLNGNMVSNSVSFHTVHGGNIAGVTVGAAACLAIFNRKRVMKKAVPKDKLKKPTTEMSTSV